MTIRAQQTAAREKGTGPPAKTHVFSCRVYYEDTDLSGNVYHANYLHFMERARSEILWAAGIDQRAALEENLGGYVVSGLNIRYLRPAHLGDMLTVESHCTRIHAARCLLVQKIHHNGQLLASADVEIAFIGPNGRPKRQPQSWITALTGD